MGKKNVLLVVRHPVGGIRAYFRYVYGVADLGDHSYTLVCPAGGFADYVRQIFASPPVECLEVPETSSALFKGVLAALGRTKFDLVHSHGFTAGAVSAPLAAVKRVPHLMTAHDVFLPAQFDGWRGALKRQMLSACFRQVDCIHAVSEDCAANVMEFFPALDPARVRPILNGIDVREFAGSDAMPLRQQLGAGNDRVLLGFFGRFMSQKGFRYLIDAIDILRADREMQRKPLVVTFAAGGFIREDRSEIERRGLAEFFAHQPPTDRVPAAMRAVDAVVMPSLWEACGLVAMEALLAGTPIIGSDCIGLREVLRGSPAAQVPVRDAPALAAAIKDYVNRPRTGEFREYVPLALARFDSRKHIQALKQLYDELAS
jgi:glycosyltransferase involved in cell wall biosynthesis